MTKQEELEITVRASVVIKALSELIGVKSVLVAEHACKGALDMVRELQERIDQIKKTQIEEIKKP